MKLTKRSVYVIAVRGADFVKIGITADATARMRDLQIGNHQKLELRHELKVDAVAAVAIETIAHRLFQKFHAGGEWFSMSPDEAIKTIAEIAVATDNGKNKKPYRHIFPERKKSPSRYVPLYAIKDGTATTEDRINRIHHRWGARTGFFVATKALLKEAQISEDIVVAALGPRPKGWRGVR